MSDILLESVRSYPVLHPRLSLEGGHVLVAAAFGARITEMNVLGLDVYPDPRVHYRPGFYGYVRFDRSLPYPQVEYMRMAGSLSTLAVALLAQAALWVVPPRRTWPRLAVTGFGFSWMDLFYHTLPILLGRQNSGTAEVYNSLVALGVPGRVVGASVIGISVALLILTLARRRQLVHPTSGRTLL